MQTLWKTSQNGGEVKRLLPLLVPTVVVLILWAGIEARNRHPVDRVFMGFDTWIEVEVLRQHLDLLDTFHVYIEEMDALWDRYSQESLLSQINESNMVVKVDEETFQFLKRTLDISTKTHGYFTLLAGSLSDLWGFGSEPRIPQEEEIEQAVELIRESRIELREESREVARIGQATLDFGGAAKGFLVERLGEFLQEEEASEGLINAGGTIYSLGRNTVVGIIHPREDSLIGSLNIRDQAVSTSGDYYRYFDADGVRYHHIFNPLDGYPNQDFASVTVVDESALKTDILATAVMAGGKEAFMMVADTFPGVPLIAVTPKGDIIANREGEEIFTPFEKKDEKRIFN